MSFHAVDQCRPVHADGDDDADSVSPRTLRQAADRLARFTSDQPAGVLCLAALLLLTNIAFITRKCLVALKGLSFFTMHF